jgi:hypothetical protein
VATTSPHQSDLLTENPPILGLTLVEAAERIGISHRTAHVHCVEHELGRRYNDQSWWLTLAKLG